MPEREVAQTWPDRLPDGRLLYPPDPQLNVTSDIALNDPDADPIKVVCDWLVAVWNRQGRTPQRLVMHPATFVAILDRPKIKAAMTLFAPPGFNWSCYINDHGKTWFAHMTRVPLVVSDPTLWRKLIVAELDDGPIVQRAELIFKGYKVGA